MKEAKEKIAALEAELKEKHEKELNEVKPADQVSTLTFVPLIFDIS